MQQQESQILEFCKQINQALDLPVKKFSMMNLKSSEWYIDVVKIVYPILKQKLIEIQNSPTHATIIDQLLLLLTHENIIQEDFLEIKGSHVVEGDNESIYYIVQLLCALVGRIMQDAQKQEEKQSIQKNIQNKNVQIQLNTNNVQIFENQQEQQEQNKKDYHSVLGIKDEFSPEFESSEQEEHFGGSEQIIEKKNLEKKISNKQKNQFSSSKKYTKINNNNLLDELQKKSNNQNLLKKCKSEEKLVYKKEKKIKQNKRKYNIKKDKIQVIQNNNNNNNNNKKYDRNKIDKKLTKQLKKRIRSTNQYIRQRIKSPKINKISPGQQQIQRKKKQYNIYAKQHYYNENKKQYLLEMKRSISTQARISHKLNRLLKWKNEEIKIEKQKQRERLRINIQNKRQNYINKINKLILKMEKQKQIDERKKFKEKMIKENNQAVNRMEALQTKYKEQLKMLKQRNIQKKKERHLMHSGHKQIIKQIQKDLKRQNKQFILSLTKRYQKQSVKISDDMKELTKKVIKVYKNK